MIQAKLQSKYRKLVIAARKARDQTAPLYTPLDTERREIRLITLSPGQFSSEIHCSLFKASLDENPCYEALSYVWGAEWSLRRIYIDGLRTFVTRNLEIALRYMRHASKPRILWIDAICINQIDVPERNTQVMHMGDVYRTASRVIAWLGEEGDDSDLAFEALKALPKDDQTHWDLTKGNAFEAKFMKPEYGTALNKLFDRPWWHRIWTVQESILAATLYFVCGFRQVSASILFAMQSSYWKHTRSCCGDYFWDQGRFLRENKAMDVLVDLHNWREEDLSRSRELLKLLMTFRSRGCSNPLDKVYGLLGLCDHFQRQTVVPDYDLPVSLVYEQVAFMSIQNSQSLDVFSQLCPRSSDSLLIGSLPTWVPDWTLEYANGEPRALRIRQHRNDEYNASSGSLPSAKCLGQGCITCLGELLGPLVTIDEPIVVDGLFSTTALVQSRVMAGIERALDRPYRALRGTTYHDAFYQTLTCSFLPVRSMIHDASQLYRTSKLDDRSWYDAWWKWAIEFKRDESKLNPIGTDYTRAEIRALDDMIGASLGMRTLFATKDNDLLGLAPANAKVGDMIALLAGGTVPYILRPSKKKPGCYEILGDAYVHGIMDGEAWDPENLQEIVLV